MQKLDNESIRNFQYVGFLCNDSPLQSINIWQKIKELSFSQNSVQTVSKLELSFLISDEDTLLNKENKTFLFLKDEANKIYYMPIISIQQKILMKEDNLSIIQESVLIEPFVYEYEQSFSFMHYNSLSFYHDKEHAWDYNSQLFLNNKKTKSSTGKLLFSIGNLISHDEESNQPKYHENYKIEFVKGREPRKINR